LLQDLTFFIIRADNDVILSYDATVAHLIGVTVALTEKTSMTTHDMQKGLQRINTTKSFQGVSGQIAFDGQGDPVNKALVLLSVDDNGFIHMEGVLGQFSKS